jgi:membrane protein required for beta-lactamase induction
MLLNTLFNYVLFSSVNYILRRNVSLLRIIIASFIGNISILLLEVNNGIVFIIGKVLIAIIINVICFGYKDIRYLCKNVFIFI